MKTPPATALTGRASPGAVLAKKLASFGNYLRQHWTLYLMLIPGLFFLFIYKLLPLYGLQIAFKDYKIFAAGDPWSAIAASEWCGFEHFAKLFGSSQFTKVLTNTLVINGLKILWLFPIPIICAILLNEIRQKIYQKLCQTLIYVPYFFSWVLIFGIFYSLLGSYGIVNNIIASLGGSRVGFFSDQSVFRSVLVFTEGWKEIGYNTIIYLAAITGIDVTPLRGGPHGRGQQVQADLAHHHARPSAHHRPHAHHEGGIHPGHRLRADPGVLQPGGLRRGGYHRNLCLPHRHGPGGLLPGHGPGPVQRGGGLCAHRGCQHRQQEDAGPQHLVRRI